MRVKSKEDQKLIELLEPIAKAEGFEIVRIRLMGEQTRRLQVMAERPSDGEITIDECARLSRAFSTLLDEQDPIEGEYLLEVSSPGVDRPLTRFADFETYEGLEARLELDRLVEGRKRFRGILAGVEGDDQVAIDLEGEEETALIPFDWVIEAKLVLTDDLMKKGAEAKGQPDLNDEDFTDEEEEG